MTLLKALLALIVALPEIIKMLQNLQRIADKAEEDRRVKDDLKKINEAFENKDAEALNRVFDS